MAILLDQIIPWGRSRHEYDLMFRLAFEDLSAGVLDCGGGPASFTAELSVSGIRAISVDPVYVFSGLEIQGRFEAVVEPMFSQIRATPGDWTWTYHRDASINISSNSRMELLIQSLRRKAVRLRRTGLRDLRGRILSLQIGCGSSMI